MFSKTGIVDCSKKPMWLKTKQEQKEGKVLWILFKLKKKNKETQLSNAIHKPRLDLEFKRKKERVHAEGGAEGDKKTSLLSGDPDAGLNPRTLRS